jgi:purine nucleosidase
MLLFRQHRFSPAPCSKATEQTQNSNTVLVWFAAAVKPAGQMPRLFATLRALFLRAAAVPRPIIIDTDPGTDDAVAIMLALAAPELEVLGLVAVAGNLPLDLTERNARAVLELAGRAEIPVYAGCPRPLDGNISGAEHVHGESGLGSLLLPPPSVLLQAQHGVDFLIDRLRAAPPKTLTLCALGPLTDIALALVKAPDIAERVAELVIMGGASRALGNITPAAEFNIHADPQAAAVVFANGLRVTMIPLDVTQQLRSEPPRIARLRALGNRCGAAAATMMQAPTGGLPLALHDPCVIAWLLAPELFAGAAVNVAVETHSPLSRGMTVVDWRGISGRPPNARVLTTIDADGFFALLTERIAALP